MRCRSKIAIVSAGVAAVVFAATYTIESLRQRDEVRRLNEQVLASRGKLIGFCYCAPPPILPASYLAGFALLASPIVYAPVIAPIRVIALRRAFPRRDDDDSRNQMD